MIRSFDHLPKPSLDKKIVSIDNNTVLMSNGLIMYFSDNSVRTSLYTVELTNPIVDHHRGTIYNEVNFYYVIFRDSPSVVSTFIQEHLELESLPDYDNGRDDIFWGVRKTLCENDRRYDLLISESSDRLPKFIQLPWRQTLRLIDDGLVDRMGNYLIDINDAYISVKIANTKYEFGKVGGKWKTHCTPDEIDVLYIFITELIHLMTSSSYDETHLFWGYFIDLTSRSQSGLEKLIKLADCIDIITTSH